MTEQELKTLVTTTIQESVDDTKLQHKNDLLQQQETLRQSMNQLKGELDTFVAAHDFTNAVAKENEYNSTKKQYELLTRTVEAYGDDVNLIEIDYTALNQAIAEVQKFYGTELKAKIAELLPLLSQIDAIQQDVFTINNKASTLIGHILTKKGEKAAASTTQWATFTGGTEAGKALKTLHALANGQY